MKQRAYEVKAGPSNLTSTSRPGAERRRRDGAGVPYLMSTALLVSDGLLAIGYAGVKALI